jgi:hypothetical protein
MHKQVKKSGQKIIKIVIRIENILKWILQQ